MYYKVVNENGYYGILCKEKRNSDWEYYTNLMGIPVTYAQKSLAETDVQELRQAYGVKRIVGYFNWCDTICKPCVDKHNIDVSTFSTLTWQQAQKDDGYTCDYCGHTFPQDKEN